MGVPEVWLVVPVTDHNKRDIASVPNEAEAG